MTKNILLIITGSVAAYKSMDLVRLLTKKSHNVTCILTKSAQEFITPLLASSLSGNKTYTVLFEADDEIDMGHIQLSRQADLIVVAPATADFIAKIANGYADDLASNVILAANKKIMIAPAMNEKMWQNVQTQKNLRRISEANISIIEPETDILACGELGMGKMSSPDIICQSISDFFTNQDLLKGKKILLTGGATFEKIDPVRFIGNHSSGKQAIEIARILSEMGAEVTFVAGNIKSAIPLPKKHIIEVGDTQEMLDAVTSNLNGSDVFIACAAVADFRVKNASNQKIKKTDSNHMTLELEKNPDILHYVGNASQRPKLVVGFAAESSNLEKYAKDKLEKKNCDLIVANDIESGAIFGSNETKVLLLSKNATKDLGKISKTQLATFLAHQIVELI